MQKCSLRSLPKKRDFELVFKGGSSAAARYFIVHARPNDLPWNRLGLSVGKKIGTAVVRNRIKRLLRETVRRLCADFPRKYDFVIVVKKSAAESKLEQLMRDMERSLPEIVREK